MQPHEFLRHSSDLHMGCLKTSSGCSRLGRGPSARFLDSLTRTIYLGPLVWNPCIPSYPVHNIFKVNKEKADKGPCLEPWIDHEADLGLLCDHSVPKQECP